MYSIFADAQCNRFMAFWNLKYSPAIKHYLVEIISFSAIVYSITHIVNASLNDLKQIITTNKLSFIVHIGH